MADRYLIETSAVDGYQLEDGSGVWILEAGAATILYTQLEPAIRGLNRGLAEGGGY